MGTRPANVSFKQLTYLGRETLLYPVIWDGDWPKIYEGIPEEIVDLTNFPKHAKFVEKGKYDSEFLDDFTEGSLHPEWLTLRNSLQDNLLIEQGNMKIYGQNCSLEDLATPSFIGIRQTEHEEIFELFLNRDKTSVGKGKIGIACLINQDHHAALLLSKSKAGGYDVIRQQKVADIKIQEKISHITELPDSLMIIHSKETKIFKIIMESNKQISFTTSAIHFSNEAIASLNTGNIQGLYVLGEGQMVVRKVRRRENH